MRLLMTTGFNDKMFQNQIKTMMLTQHKNIVQFLGFCSNTEETVTEHLGELIMADIRERLLCFEYLSNGSLDRYVSDASCGLEWRLRYQIIKGICDGLHYLHGNHIVTMDLNSTNILLDDNMVPKIANFCLLRVFAKEKIRTWYHLSSFFKKLGGTDRYREVAFQFRCNYMVPEYLFDGVLSYKFDIYCLGIIITEILTGQKVYFANNEKLLESWKNRLLHTSSADLILLEQVRVCAEISRACRADDPDEWPDTGRIIKMLLETETNGAGAQGNLLYMEFNELECILKGAKKPGILSHQLLSLITGKFSCQQEIGRSEFAVTYRGILLNPRITVKRLSTTKEFDDRLFNNEINTLILAQHKNIVRFVGYTQEEAREYQGELIMPDTRERLLCFEYLSNGSLKDHVSVIGKPTISTQNRTFLWPPVASRGLEWGARYQIIKGICEGVHYLHGNNIVHGELRLSNVLLDDMDPKIAYFCLSRCFVEHQRSVIMPNKIKSMGYMAPEVFAGCITFTSDIYSLGIIIAEILTGRKDIAKENVLESWRTRLGTSLTDILLEQVRVCTEIRIACINPNPERRPDMQRIIEMLDETECEEPAEQ
ncbi:probable serine/threonine-protein kinase PBL11 [Panicum virgatum]|nr:probable serine/threonine-protein kinase PBL11 [Panicum virgatum]XP_039853419.1 probable serine/threonine-protein kinase PBL11 [Panicum virgatum]